MQRALRLAAWAVLVVMAVLCACATGACAASAPAILRTDAFIATPYDSNTVLVFFSSSALAPAGLGASAGKLPKSVSMVAGWSAKLWLENADGESRWARYWMGGEGSAPKLGDQYLLATGENNLEHGMLSSVGYLKVCEDTWLVGLVTIEEADRDKYADWSLPVGMVAYPEPEGGMPVLKPILNRDEFAKLPSNDVMKDDHSLSIFPLDALPMLEQGDSDSGDRRILLTVQHTGDSVIFSLKRVTPGGLAPAGVYFESHCPGFYSDVYPSQDATQPSMKPPAQQPARDSTH